LRLGITSARPANPVTAAKEAVIPKNCLLDTFKGDSPTSSTVIVKHSCRPCHVCHASATCYNGYCKCFKSNNPYNIFLEASDMYQASLPARKGLAEHDSKQT
jgi:hypothetical protein